MNRDTLILSTIVVLCSLGLAWQQQNILDKTVVHQETQLKRWENEILLAYDGPLQKTIQHAIIASQRELENDRREEAAQKREIETKVDMLMRARDLIPANVAEPMRTKAAEELVKIMTNEAKNKAAKP